MSGAVSVRTAAPADLAEVDALLARSYPRILAADYAPSVMVLAVPIIARARPELLASGRYYLALDSNGVVLGAGGWSMDAPGPSDQRPPDQGPSDLPKGRAEPNRTGHVRHVATDPDALRRGVGRAIMKAVFDAASGAGVTGLHCMSTRTAEPFYASLGFRKIGLIEVPLRPGITFPAVQMRCDLS